MDNIKIVNKIAKLIREYENIHGEKPQAIVLPLFEFVRLVDRPLDFKAFNIPLLPGDNWMVIPWNRHVKSILFGDVGDNTPSV